ncbi:hypothetical protein [Aureivirga sp. CE67]|uniref:hypothetical protein n=1 Tax=Aureivirga sp. CE67 TaxID=1788983 RepID=UPI0018CB0ACB|nr:hypothetical protein [Aureivirga sp. CE67]
MKKIIYSIWIFVLTIFLVQDYLYIIPYNQDAFFDIWPKDIVFSLRWFVLFNLATFSMLPLLKKKKIGFLAIVLFLGIIMKPILIKKVPKQTAEEFVFEKEEDLFKIIDAYNADQNLEKINSKIQSIGIEHFSVEKDVYVFTINSFSENSTGIVLNKKEKLPKNILSSKTNFEYLFGDWYVFRTT